MNNYILPIKPGSQIGLFGGSFNPAHEWHFQVSKNALSELNLNQVIWLVSMSNPLKEDEDIMDFHDRFMSARDIAKKKNFFVSDFEKEYKGEVSKSGVAILPSKRMRKVPIQNASSPEDKIEESETTLKLTEEVKTETEEVKTEIQEKPLPTEEEEK